MFEVFYTTPIFSIFNTYDCFSVYAKNKQEAETLAKFSLLDGQKIQRIEKTDNVKFIDVERIFNAFKNK